jgi:hypothetical protein
MVASGAAQVRFNGGTTSATTSSNQIVVYTVNSSGNQNDIGITVSVNGGPTSNEFKMTSLTPWSLQSTGDSDEIDTSRGWRSLIGYSIKDQFGTILPADVPLNEKFTSGWIIDYPGTNWNTGLNAGSINAPPSGWVDRLSPGVYPPGSGTNVPAALPPLSPLSTTTVMHVNQEWYIGSLDTGKGRRVQTDVIQFYVDHGRHLNIVSPNP